MDPPPQAHSVQFYAEDAFLLDSLTRSVSTGLSAGDATIVIATQAHHAGLLQRLNVRGVNVADAVQQGRYLPLDAREALMQCRHGERLDRARFLEFMSEVLQRVISVDDGEAPRVNIFGEIVALLWAERRGEEAIELEEAWNELGQRYPFHLWCAYPISGFGRAEDRDAFARICSAHSHVVPTEMFTSLSEEADRLRAVSVLQQKSEALEREVSERARIQEALLRSEKISATSRVAAAIAHEINNPLESLTNLLYIVQNSPSLDSSARRYAGLAEQELRRISYITRQMLSFYREAREAEPFALTRVLEDILELYSAKISYKNIIVRRSLETVGTIDGFPSEMRQLFGNLIGNAIEAIGQNGRITIHAREACDWRDPARRGVRIVVVDNGPGILPENRKHMFEPFFTTKGESGTGLGLWVSHGIVQKHDGLMRFRTSTRAGQSGTAFSVFLPCKSTTNVEAAKVA